MRRILLGTILLTGMFISGGVFAINLPHPSKPTPSKSSKASMNSCLLNTMNSTLVAMANDGLKSNALAFDSNSNVKQTMINIKNKYCSKQNITITTQGKLVVITSASPSDSYVFYAWYKDDHAAIGRLNSQYQLI